MPPELQTNSVPWVGENVLRVDGDLKRQQEASLLDILAAMWRRKLLMASVLTLGFLAGMLAIGFIQPQYTGEAVVQVALQKINLGEPGSVQSNPTADEQTIFSEVLVIQSPAVAGRVIDQFDLMRDPEFNRFLAKPKASPVGLVKGFVEWVNRSIKVGDVFSVHLDRPDIDSMQSGARAAVIDDVLGHLKVENKPKSYTIFIRFTSFDPVKAATIANAFADQYLQYQIETNSQIMDQINAWLGGELEQKREQVRRDELAIQEFRERHGILHSGPQGVSIALQRLNEINKQLTDASVARASIEARAKRTQELVRAGRTDEIPEVLASPLIQRLRESETLLLRQKAELASRYDEGHPKLNHVEAEAQDLTRKIQAEVEKIVSGTTSELAIATTREEKLRGQLKELHDAVEGVERAEMQSRQLEREAESSRMMLRDLAGRFQQTNALRAMQQVNAHLVSAAGVPLYPSQPKKTVVLGLAMIASCVVTMVIVWLLERSEGFRGTREVEQVLDTPCLSAVPSLQPSWRRFVARRREVDQLQTIFAEAIRTVRTLIRISKPEVPFKVLLVTSSVSKEGKSTFAIALARAFAEAEHKTLLIDGDLRRPAISNLMDIEPGWNLSDVLTEKTSVATAVHRVEEERLHVLVNKQAAQRAQDLLGSPAMERVIRWTAGEYDAVIVDTPPVMLVADALLIAPLADSLLYVVRWMRTPQEVVTAGLARLRKASARHVGVVLSRVQIMRDAKNTYDHDMDYLSPYRNRYLGHR